MSSALLAILLVCQGAGEPLTIAETSDYRTTASHAQVMEFCRQLAERSKVVRLASLGKTTEGREMPLLFLADPPVASAEEASLQAARGDKLVVFAMGNLHAGEVCGKEALLMLAREIAAKPTHPLLKDLIIALAPIINADGNERVSKENRPEQRGPESGVGIRANAAGLDLNRDFMKLEAPECQALVRFLNACNPAILVDTHTTNGSHHRYTITYDGPRHPATDPDLVKHVRDDFLPEVGRRLEKETGYRAFYYGNFNREHTEWTTYPAQARYLGHYGGLRNRLTVLSEAYSYAPFRDRVLATQAFVRHTFLLAAEQKARINQLLTAARDRMAGASSAGDGETTANNSARSTEPIALGSELTPLDRKFTILGFVEEQRDGKRLATEQPQEYDVRYVAQSRPTKTVQAPYAYLIPAEHARTIDVLRQHGIEMQVLREEIELDVEQYRIDEFQQASREFQKHRMMSVLVTPQVKPRRFSAGTALVRTAQPLGRLLVNLLEPAAEDSLCAWNLFDANLTIGGDFPVARLLAPQIVLAAPLRASRDPALPRKPITFQVINGRNPPNFSGSPASGFQWLDEGEHYLETKRGQLRKVNAMTGRSEVFHNPVPMTRALASLPTLDQATAARWSRGPGLQMNAKRTAALFQHENDLYYATLDGKTAARLTSTPSAEQFSAFSPNGNFVAYVRDDNLHVVDVATQTDRALTSDGNGMLRNGRASWVYFEEIFDRRWDAFKWSSDSSRLAFMQFDDSPVPQFTVVNEIPGRQRVETERYPRAGDPNPRVKLGVVTAAGGSVRWIDLSSYSPDSILVTGFGWLPDSQGVYFYVQDRAQRWLDFNTADADRGTSRRLFREKTQAWVDLPEVPRFLKDGSFVFTSERSGWKHLYHFAKDGALKQQITSGDWEARSVKAIDESGGWVYFSGTKDSPIAENLYRVKLDGSDLSRLTPGDGNHATNVATGGKRFIDSVSNHRTPPTVALRQADGTPARTLDTNPVPALEEYQFGSFELLQIATRDGFLLEGSLTKPPNFDPQKKYPVWFMTYGGPHLATVSDAWQGGRAFDHMLATLGIVVFRCDPRSASGKGATSTWTAYKQLGVQELRDVEDAIGWLTSQPYIDAKRVGMSGHSYGGFLTAYCLTHTRLFAAGIAGAPVTDWRNYDTIYTERFMDTPQENPEGYQKTSVVAAAGNLHGKLLLLHGGIDDNVHPQNTMQLVQALQAANKDFELMVYPQSRHGLFGPHYQRLMVEFIKRTMLGER